jgi:hypothetical protein
MLLILDVLLYHRERSAPDCAYKVRVGPQCWELALEHWKLLTEQPRGAAFHETHEPMDAKLWIALDQQMHMIWHDFYTQ